MGHQGHLNGKSRMGYGRRTTMTGRQQVMRLYGTPEIFKWTKPGINGVCFFV
jgi:hypothetical protein